MRILAVDDDPVVLDLLRNSLGQSGFGDVTFANSAEEALKLLDSETEPFDTFLLDIMMPGMSGVELCALLRERDRYRATPIIMITAERTHNSMARAFDAGATDYVTKPFDGLELGTRINLAAMLNDSLRRERLSMHKLEELSRLTKITFDERFDLDSAPGVTTFLSLENDLLRRGDAVYPVTLFSVRMDDALSLFREMSPAQYREAVEMMAHALGDTFDTDVTRFAFAGRGCFVGVIYSRARVDIAELNDRLNDILAAHWDAQLVRGHAAPEACIELLEDRRLWSGRSAAEALRGFHKRAELHTQAEPEEVNNLFARLRTKMRAT